MSTRSEAFQRWASLVSGPDWFWYAKVLSGNDTLLNGAHQAGPYVPRDVIFELFPSISRSAALNPRSSIQVLIDSHGAEAAATAIWYNNRVAGGGTRNEARVTNWGGRASPLLDPEATGSICILAFHRAATGGDADVCRVWLCSSVEEEEAVTDLIGPVDPGVSQFFRGTAQGVVPARGTVPDLPCRISVEEMPQKWRFAFPEAHELVRRATENLPSVRERSPDERLLRRRVCEYEIFRSVEDAVVLPRIREGFATVDLFVSFANSVTNRRKSRSGASLELHTKTIFDEEGLAYSHDEYSEGRKRPDFLFPSAEAYRNPGFPAERLQMLAVKTTCKDRWRQILNEADRVPRKFLLTLQEGVSYHQFDEMTEAGVSLVVPAPVHSSYPKQIRQHLLSLSHFIGLTRARCR